MSLRVALDARVRSGAVGGVEQVLIGLAFGLAQLEGDELYEFVTYEDSSEWLNSFISRPAQIITSGRAPTGTRVARRAANAANRFPPIGRALRGAVTLGGRSPLPNTDGLIERRKVDVVHFVRQFGAFRTAVPSIYQPHDLQHLHMPQFFSSFEVAARERIYRAACDQAESVAVMSEWGRQDLVSRYNLRPEKVVVVPWASVLEAYGPPSPADQERVLAMYALPDRYLLYPARSWRHKNHEGLLRVIAHLRDSRRLRVNLVCAGSLDNHNSALTATIGRLRLGDQVRFTGYVPEVDLAVMYQKATALVFPSLFEGWGMPVLEAFYAGLPVACSNVTSLPSLAAGAALLFDPNDEEAIANAVERLWTDAELRRSLTSAGRRRAMDFSWERTARIFRAHYRRVAGHALDRNDRRLIESPALV